jgi:hypothetical protein
MAGIGRDSTHFTEEELVWFFYGEAENAAEIDLHLQLCRRCRAEYEALKMDMGTIASWTVPDRGPDYGQDVWRALVQKDASIASRKRFRWSQWLQPRRLAAAAAMAALITVAFVAGRISGPPEAAPPTTAAIVRERLLAAALSDHLEQSERTLLEITNANAGGSVDISAEQRRAESLLNGNRLYRQAAARQGHPALTDVLEDLERVLLDIAHSPAELSPADAQRLRARVEDQELLFRLRVLELRLRRVQDEPLQQLTPKDSKG